MTGRRQRVSKRDDYETPDDLFELVDSVFSFDLDAAATARTAKCNRYLGPGSSDATDALKTIWFRHGSRIWCNPPFATKEYFFEQALASRNLCQVIVFLVPNNSRETEWWNKYVRKAADTVITLIPRVNYLLDGQLCQGVEFGSALVVYYPRIPGVQYYAPTELTWNWHFQVEKKKQPVYL